MGEEGILEGEESRGVLEGKEGEEVKKAQERKVRFVGERYFTLQLYLVSK